jgi:hypothetical protein
LRENTLGEILRTPPCLVNGGLEKGERELLLPWEKRKREVMEGVREAAGSGLGRDI